MNYISAEIDSMVTASVNTAVLEGLTSGLSYSELIAVEKDAEGNITLLASDAYKINAINRQVAVYTQEKLTAACNKGVYVPLGALTGITWIAGYGKEFNLDVLTAESVICQFFSEFDSTGINQTRHAIYLQVISLVRVIMPAAIKDVTVVTDVLLCEAIIVGKIPEVYLNNGLWP